MSELHSSRRDAMCALAILPTILAAPAAASAATGLTCLPTRAFPAALAKYRKARADFDRIAEEGDDKGADVAGNISDRAFEAMLRAPSRHAADIAIKIETLIFEYTDCIMDEDRLALISQDARRLHGEDVA